MLIDEPASVLADDSGRVSDVGSYTEYDPLPRVRRRRRGPSQVRKNIKLIRLPFASSFPEPAPSPRVPIDFSHPLTGVRRCP
jgi:hypothetical protein